MARKPTKTSAGKTVETLKHDEAKRKNIPTAEHQSVLQKEQEAMRTAFQDTRLRFFAAISGGRGRIDEALRLVELEDRRDSVVATLSGGMRTRASLACALRME